MTPAIPLDPSMFAWQRQEPLHTCMGFILNGGTVSINCGYSIYPGAVLLMAFVKIADTETKCWRYFWTSTEAAVSEAEKLVDDAYEYLCGALGCRPREEENLNLDDFMHHLDMRINNGFH